jgi:hypothetical protein
MVWSAISADHGFGLYFCVTVVSFILGHIVSMASRYLFEKEKLHLKKPFQLFFGPPERLASHCKSELKEAVSILLPNQTKGDLNKRFAVVYCQKHNPNAYDTAFWFLFTYEVSRSLGLVFLILAFLPPLILIFGKIGLCHAIIGFISSLIVSATLLRNYAHFKMYFYEQIGADLLIAARELELERVKKLKTKENPHEG